MQNGYRRVLLLFLCRYIVMMTYISTSSYCNPRYMLTQVH